MTSPCYLVGLEGRLHERGDLVNLNEGKNSMFRKNITSRLARFSQFVSSLVVGTALLSASAAHAGSIVEISGGPATGLEGLGSFTGSIEYSTANAFSTTGTLVVTLTNTSPAANGGFITGFLFNIGGSDASASATLQAGATHPFAQCTGTGLNGMPFGMPFDAGAALGSSFQGGGSPAGGIGVGQTGVFTFNISAADAGLLTAMDFLNGGSFDFNFIVRFRGFEDGGSDKVGAVIVPLPPAVAMGLAGLGIAGFAARRQRRNKA